MRKNMFSPSSTQDVSSQSGALVDTNLLTTDFLSMPMTTVKKRVIARKIMTSRNYEKNSLSSSAHNTGNTAVTIVDLIRVLIVATRLKLNYQLVIKHL